MPQKLNLRNRAKIYQALKKGGHWYIVDVDNRPQGTLMILFDGFLQAEFLVLGSDILVPTNLRDDSKFFGPVRQYLTLNKGITVDKLCELIRNNPYKSDFKSNLGQTISLREATRILREKNREKTLHVS
jgi:hypothetical protein